MTVLGRTTSTRRAFTAHPDALELPDGTWSGPCLACGQPGAATLCADDRIVCANGCHQLRYPHDVGWRFVQWFLERESETT